MSKTFKPYGIEYGYGKSGERWSLSVMATSPEDAMARVKTAAAFGQCFTPHGMEEIPVRSLKGPFVPLIVWWRNLWRA